MTKPKWMKHSPEPWYTESDGDSQWYRDRNVYVCAPEGEGRVLDMYPPMGGGTKIIRKNAERVVACVNACEGIENPKEVIQKAKDLVKAFIAWSVQPADQERDKDRDRALFLEIYGLAQKLSEHFQEEREETNGTD